MTFKFSGSLLAGLGPRTHLLRALRPPRVLNLTRALATTPDNKPDEHKAKALSLIDSLPGNSIVSKTGFVAVATTLATWLVSKEIYIVNEETVVVASFFTVVFLLLKNVREPFNQFAEARMNFIKTLLNDARQNHKEQVVQRIEASTQLADIVPVTKDLFAMSKEMAAMQAKLFELKQQVAVAAEVKATLDAWVRYENAIREREQKLLAAQVMANVEKALKDSKMQAALLKEAVSDVQKLTAKK